MRKAVFLVVVLLAAFHCFGQGGYIKIEHFGKSDKPIFPVVISIIPESKARAIDEFESNFVLTNKKAFDSTINFISRFHFPAISPGEDGFNIVIGNLKNSHPNKLGSYRLLNRNLSVVFFKSLIKELAAQNLAPNLVLYLKQYILIRIDY
jgi:hypothetical protein